MSLIFTAGQTLLPAQLNALSNCKGVNMNPGGSSTTTSSSFANTASTSSVSFTKVDAASRLRVDFHATCYVTGSTGTVVEFAINLNSTDYAIVKNTLNVLSLTKQHSGILLISSIAAGTYTVQSRWRRVSGSGTVTMDTNSALSFAIMEVQE